MTLGEGWGWAGQRSAEEMQEWWRAYLERRDARIAQYAQPVVCEPCRVEGHEPRVCVRPCTCTHGRERKRNAQATP